MARKKRKRVVRKGVLLSAVLLVISMIVLFLTPLFDIGEIEIKGSGRISKAEILIESKIRKGKNIFAINKGMAEKRIKAIGYIEDVKISRQLPDKVVISVEEGVPIAYLDFDDVYAGINKEGQTLCHKSKASPPSSGAVVVGLGVKKAELGFKIVPEDGRDDEYEILTKLMETFDSYGMSGAVTWIDITNKNDIVFKHRDRLKIEFGSLNDYDLKFNYLAAMLTELGEEATGVINMQSDNYVYRNTIEQ